jgi:hypothetical protein
LSASANPVITHDKQLRTNAPIAIGLTPSLKMAFSAYIIALRQNETPEKKRAKSLKSLSLPERPDAFASVVTALSPPLSELEQMTK